MLDLLSRFSMDGIPGCLRDFFVFANDNEWLKKKLLRILYRGGRGDYTAILLSVLLWVSLLVALTLRKHRSG